MESRARTRWRRIARYVRRPDGHRNPARIHRVPDRHQTISALRKQACSPASKPCPPRHSPHYGFIRRSRHGFRRVSRSSWQRCFCLHDLRGSKPSHRKALLGPRSVRSRVFRRPSPLVHRSRCRTWGRALYETSVLPRKYARFVCFVYTCSVFRRLRALRRRRRGLRIANGKIRTFIH